jgi:hypothetical protein
LTTYVYRVLLASWGINVAMRGTARMFNEALPDSALKLERAGLLLDSSLRFTIEETNWLRAGLKMGADRVLPHLPEYANVLVELNEVTFQVTDFQEEGLACALAGLVCTAFNVAPATVAVAFDRVKNRYVFQFPPLDPTLTGDK